MSGARYNIVPVNLCKVTDYLRDGEIYTRLFVAYDNKKVKIHIIVTQMWQARNKSFIQSLLSNIINISLGQI